MLLRGTCLLALAGILSLVLLSGRGRADEPAKGVDAAASKAWPGISRRTPGLVLFRPRWRRGVLGVKDGTVRWTDGADPSRNLLVPVAAIVSQRIRCQGSGGCGEWSFRTRRTEYVFRDDAVPPRLAEPFGALVSGWPGLVSERAGTGR